MNVDAFGSASPAPALQRYQTPPPRTWSGTNSAAGTATCCGTWRPTWHSVAQWFLELSSVEFFWGWLWKKKRKKHTISGVHLVKRQLMWLKTQRILVKRFLGSIVLHQFYFRLWPIADVNSPPKYGFKWRASPFGTSSTMDTILIRHFCSFELHSALIPNDLVYQEKFCTETLIITPRTKYSGKIPVALA